MTTTLRAIGMVAASIPASLDFYRLLGVDAPDSGDSPHAEVQLDSGIKVMWDSEQSMRSMDPEWTRPTGGVAVGLAFDCEDAEGVDRTYATVLAAGYAGKSEPWDAPWGQRYATVVDPDGNPVDLYAAV